jgi:hypothetical protein
VTRGRQDFPVIPIAGIPGTNSAERTIEVEVAVQGEIHFQDPIGVPQPPHFVLQFRDAPRIGGAVCRTLPAVNLRPVRPRAPQITQSAQRIRQRHVTRLWPGQANR